MSLLKPSRSPAADVVQTRWPIAAYLFCIAVCSPCAAQEDKTPGDESTARQRSKQHLKIMNATIKSLVVTLNDGEDGDNPGFAEDALLRYNDSTRAFFDAGVWKLSDGGRPLALLTLEMYGSPGKSALLMHEFCALSKRDFTVASPQGIHWAPKETGLEFRTLPEAPEPADTAAKRLAQMRSLARRISAVEEYGGRSITLRLMPQPLDRYSDSNANILDGGIFAYANGTNPELALLLETSDKGWSYGVVRVSLAQLKVSLDGELVHTIPHFQGATPESGYYSAAHDVTISD